uniref:hypothetical protein n=1 Tax=Sinorhizobium chiapasense TaxID=501572 RepID=UPI002FE34F4B
MSLRVRRPCALRDLINAAGNVLLALSRPSGAVVDRIGIDRLLPGWREDGTMCSAICTNHEPKIVEDEGTLFK